MAKKLCRSPVTHFLVHQKLADALLLGELQTSDQFRVNSVIWVGADYYVLHLRRVFVAVLLMTQ
jgi:hypothetical protein